MLHLPEFSAGLSCRLRIIFNPDARLVSAMQPVMLVAAYLVRRFRRLESGRKNGDEVDFPLRRVYFFTVYPREIWGWGMWNLCVVRVMEKKGTSKVTRG